MHHERPILVEVGNDRPLAGPASPEGQELLHAKVAALLANSPLRDALLDEVLESIREEGLPGEAGPASPIVAAGAHPAAAVRSGRGEARSGGGGPRKARTGQSSSQKTTCRDMILAAICHERLS